MAIFKQLILMGVMFLYGHLAIWGQDTLCNETPNNMRLKIGKQTGEEFEIYVDLINKGSNPVYISTDPIQINGSRGFYLSVDRDESSTLVVSTRVFGPIIYSPYSSHRYVTLRKLEPKQYFPFTVKVRFPIKETLPPVDDPRMARVITRKEIEKVTFELGFFPEDVTLLDLLKSKPFDWTVNGEELLYTGDSKGKHLFDIQQLARCSTKIAGYQ